MNENRRRLENLKEIWLYGVKRFSPQDDIAWLIEQVEQVQELDEELKVTSDAFVRANKKLLLLDRQNKRYRELLEKVDYLLEKAGEAHENIYDLISYVRTLID